ncbi:MAG TPA: hypothetical protein VNT79_09830 [Phycisphaerae bacterium]|nr:hypothetical protein [Phycisphaerae bacterium]
MPTAPFGLLDWSIVAAYFIITTVVAALLTGKQATIRDFFLGGRKLPWWAVSGSIVAAEISAVTFIAVPGISYARGGDLTYLQLGIGAIIARLIVGLFFVPRYYEQEIYSPYDFMGNQLGPRVRTATTLLFFVGGTLGQGARILVTSVLLQVVAGIDVYSAIACLGAFGIAWSFIGGITTVVWTDVAQFVILVVGAVAALIFAVYSVDGGLDEVLHLARDKEKLRVFELGSDLSLNYTLLVGLLCTPFLNVAAFGVDQSIAQRMFCCKTPRQASLAIYASCIGQGIAVLMLLVGVAIYAYFVHNPPTSEEQAAMATEGARVLPLYIIRAMPPGLRGLLVAAIFAASMSSSAIMALSQSTLAAFKQPVLKVVRAAGWRGRAPGDVLLSRGLIVFWGIVLSLVAIVCIPVRESYPNAIDLVLSIVAYTYGPLLGIFLLAFLPFHRDDRGLLWAVPLGMLAVFGLTVHAGWLELGWPAMHLNLSDVIVWTGAGVTLVLAILRFRDDLGRIATVTVGVLVIVILHRFQLGLDELDRPVYPSPYWAYPVGTLMTLFVGWGLGNKVGKRRNPV